MHLSGVNSWDGGQGDAREAGQKENWLWSCLLPFSSTNVSAPESMLDAWDSNSNKTSLSSSSCSGHLICAKLTGYIFHFSFS